MPHLQEAEQLHRSARLVRFTTFEVNFELRELRKCGARLRLQHKPFRILEMLLEQPGALVTRAELANGLWPTSHVNFEHSLNTAMNTLRQVLEDTAHQSRLIETRSGLGYRFIAPVEEVLPVSAPVVAREDQGFGPVHEDCLKGRYFLNRMTCESVQRAIGCFQSAVEQDRRCAPAWAGMADAYSRLAQSGTAASADICHLAREAAWAAVNCDERLAAAQVALGSVRLTFDVDLQGAHSDLIRAIVLDRDSGDAHRALATLLSASGNHTEALQAAWRAQALEPLSLPIGLELAGSLYRARDFNATVTQCWNLLSLEPRCAPAQTLLGLAYERLGLHDEAVTELENACICSDRHPAAVCALGCAAAAAGEREQAGCALNELDTSLVRTYISSCWRAAIHAMLGDSRAALEELWTACTRRDPLLLWIGVDPGFDGLRGTSGFSEIIRRAGLGGRITRSQF